MKKNSKLITLIAIIAVIVVIVFTISIILFLTLKKSNDKLFAEYLDDNLNDVIKIFDDKELNAISDIINQNKYQDKTSLSMNLENDKILLDLFRQRENVIDKTYTDARLSINTKEVFNIKSFIQKSMISIKIPDIYDSYISVKTNNFISFISKLGLVDNSIISTLPETVNFDNLEAINDVIPSYEEIKSLKDKYLDIVISNTEKNEYSKQSNSKITVNSNTIDVDEYVLTLSADKTKKMYLDILENLKNEETFINKLEKIDEKLLNIVNLSGEYKKQIQEKIDSISKNDNIQSLKCTLYIQNNKVVRIKIEEGNEKEIIIDTISGDQIIGIEIKASSYVANNEKEIKFSLRKNKNDSFNYAIDMTIDDNSGVNEIAIELSAENRENNVKINADVTINGIDISYRRNINILNKINFEENLDKANIILNNLNPEVAAKIIKLYFDSVIEEYGDIFTKEIDKIMKKEDNNIIDNTNKKENDNESDTQIIIN